MRRGLTVLDMHGSTMRKQFAKSPRINDRGLHVGEVVHKGSGILADNPRQASSEELERMNQLFQQSS
jgi:hypothetical protein